MVALRDGKQAHDITDRESGAVEGKLNRKRDRESGSPEKENVKPEPNLSKGAARQENGREDVEDYTAGSNLDQKAPSKNVKQDAGRTKKRRKADDEGSDEGNINDSSRIKDQHAQDDKTLNDGQQTKQAPKERTRKALEFEWDRSQLRDPRPTPERVLPPRRSESDLTEQEKEFFRGSPPKRPNKKGRLNAFDKDEMFREGAKKNLAHHFHEIYHCHEKGPKGSPTYDESGFQLDYHKVADWMKPQAYNKSAMVNGMEKRLKRMDEEKAKMVAAFFQGGKGPEEDALCVEDLLKDKVSKDLGVAFHKVTPTTVEEWAAKGFAKEDPSKYVRSTITKEEQKRFLSLSMGASLRK